MLGRKNYCVMIILESIINIIINWIEENLFPSSLPIMILFHTEICPKEHIYDYRPDTVKIESTTFKIPCYIDINTLGEDKNLRCHLKDNLAIITDTVNISNKTTSLMKKLYSKSDFMLTPNDCQNFGRHFYLDFP